MHSVIIAVLCTEVGRATVNGVDSGGWGRVSARLGGNEWDANPATAGGRVESTVGPVCGGHGCLWEVCVSRIVLREAVFTGLLLVTLSVEIFGTAAATPQHRQAHEFNHGE